MSWVVNCLVLKGCVLCVVLKGLSIVTHSK